ncbi:polysaccharide biosynthesis/export family protein [Coleofasciculus sp. FACHB-SPT36]|nr:polysaccharide biosynthesis/export family protein [Coleofasciculus sp. FACHB-SPT36]
MRSNVLLFSFFLIVIGACSTPRKTIYFSQGGPGDTVAMTVLSAEAAESTIRPDDILAINVTSISSVTLEKDPVAIFKEGGTTAPVTAVQAGMSQSAVISGYLVDGEGSIDFPVIGKLRVAGLTITQAKEALVKRLSAIVRNPIVEMRITNYKVSVLGEVARPGIVLAPNHKLSVLEALASVGDIPITGRKDNIKIIRNEGGVQHIGVLNLNDRSVFKSPYYYLKQNDIVYVTPTSVRRQETNEFTRVYLPTITTLLSAVLAVYGIVQISR